MASFHKKITFLSTAIVVTAAISIVACAEKAEDGSHAEKAVSTVTDSQKVAEKTLPTSDIIYDRTDPLQREAESGDSEALYDLAYKYENGIGVPKDETKALELFKKAAGHDKSTAPRK
jgi:TPR repeat protein